MLHQCALVVAFILLVFETASVGAFLSGDPAYPRFHSLDSRLRATTSLENDNTKTLSKKRRGKKSTPKSFRTPQQRRPKHKETRRPKYYWKDLGNVVRELEDFWVHCGVDIHQPLLAKKNEGFDNDTTAAVKKNKRQKQQPLCIPNEALLHYRGRHDLRAAIVTYGGREEMAYELTYEARRHVTIMPGKWADAVASSIELQIMLQNQTHSEWMSEKEAPTRLLPQRKRKQKQHSKIVDNSDTAQSSSQPKKKYAHQENRKPRWYWNQQKVVEELYDYLDVYKELHGRPSIWFPRASELEKSGRDDLTTAMRRYGGNKRIMKIAGLIPFRDWNFFEGQYELLLLLKEYLDENSSEEDDDGGLKYKFFPNVSEIRSKGNDRLYRLVQYYGGAKFLSSRLGMTHVYGKSAAKPSLSWGQFSLEFAIRLCEFIRHLHMNASPPISNPVISIPSPARLQRAGPEGIWLHEKIMEFGGYENVARRLYLEY